MLPYTPLHHLLLAKMGSPLVATSGNLSDEPICIDEQEAVQRLRGIADFFLVHNRPIVRHVDDSIVRVMAGRELVLRRARGYAPLPIQIRDAGSAGSGTNQDLESKPKLETILAVGAHLKNAVALASGWQIFISQHIGDLESAQAFDAFQRVASDFQSLYDSPAERVAADAHPDYLSTRFAKTSGLPCTTVQHHVAHVLSCMGENEICPPALGVSWDGTGYGLDGTIWGGEFFRIHKDGAERVAYLRRFRLPGGEQAIKEPRRSALGLLFESVGEAAFESAQLVPKAFSSGDLATLRTMLLRNLNSPWTSSAGRLFDGVASLMGMRQRASFEGQAAMELEFLIGETQDSGAYELVSNKEPVPVLDWRPAIQAIVTDVRAGVAPSLVSARFHNMLVESIVTVARQTGLERVVLSGGCFQNRYLTEHAIQRLRAEGFRPYWHQRIPPNDGGICLGQVVAARWWKV
jgi:hydrogenase maturation protein HypF